MNKLDELKQKHKELGEAIKRLEGNGGQWVPEKGDKVWVVTYCEFTKAPIYTRQMIYLGGARSSTHMRQGNMYRTKEEAECALEMETYEFGRSLHIADVNRIIDEANGDWVADWSLNNQTKANLIYDRLEGCLNFEMSHLLEPCLELKPFKPEAFGQITSRITQEQIDYIWRLNKPEGVKS